ARTIGPTCSTISPHRVVTGSALIGIAAAFTTSSQSRARGTTGTIGNKPISTYGDGYGYTRGAIGRDQVNTYTDRSGFTTGTIGRRRVNCFTDRLRTTKCY